MKFAIKTTINATIIFIFFILTIHASDLENKIYIDDSVIISIFGHCNANPYKVTKLFGGDFTLGTKISSIWVSGIMSYTFTRFDITTKIANHPSNNGLAEINNPRPDKSRQDIFTVGAGIMYRFFFPTFSENNLGKFFHTTSAFLTYNLVKDKYVVKDYNGFGLKAIYALNRRFNVNFDLSIRFSYNLLFVKRAESFKGEAVNDRQLFLSWPEVGAGFNFYF